MNPPQYFSDLSTEELDRAEQVAARRASDALKEWQRERAKLKEIKRVKTERDSK